MKRYKARNQQWTFWLGGMAVGALAMYLADPAQGKRRRALVQEKMLDVPGRTGSAINFALQDTGNRLSAWQSQAKSMLHRGTQSANDRLVQAKVDSRLDEFCRSPDEISADVDQGYVTLTGSIQADEHAKLIRSLYKIPGVIEVRDRLDIDHSAHRVLGSLHDDRASTAQTAAQTTALLGGAVLGATRRLPVGTLLAIAGLGYLISNINNGNLRNLLSGSRARQNQSINIQRSIEIQASPDTVFDIWSRYENFPQFMSHIVEVRDLGMQRSHWVAKGPAGVNLEWDSVMTKCMPPTMLAWRTEPGSSVEHSGSVRFESANGGTRATVRMTYMPAAGAFGQGMASLLAGNPAQSLEEDLMRMKDFIESRNLPREMTQPLSSSGQMLH